MSEQVKKEKSKKRMWRSKCNTKEKNNVMVNTKKTTLNEHDKEKHEREL